MKLHNAFAQTLVDDLRPIYVRTDPSGVAYDHHSDVLYVADAHSGAITRVDGPTQKRIATIESGGVVGARVGGLAITPYGTLFATRLGHGQSGAIFRIEPDGQMEALERLPVDVKRVGITYDPREHALYSTQFRCSAQGAHDGSIVVIDLVSGEPSTLADGFLKPVGIVKLGPTVVVADARQRAVFRLELAGGRAVYRLQLAGNVDRPDSLCCFGLDSVLLTTYDEEAHRGSLRRLWLDGRSQIIASGPWEPRGVTTDGERAFVAMQRGGQVMVFMVEPSNL
jgi:DNA-binding beta-propeller fold protein YncE